MKSASIFDPSLDTLGGGEVYIGSVVECLLKHGYRVDIFWHSEEIKNQMKKLLGINIDETNIRKDGFHLYTRKGGILEKRRLTKNYDLTFFVSDGSIPWLFSRRNILHFQIPFTGVNGASFSNQLKMKSIHRIICNSRFTKRFIDREYKVKSDVIYPPTNIVPKKRVKQNTILSVARFTTALHHKRQDVLVKTFNKLVDNGLEGWRLKLIGSSGEGLTLVKNLRKKSKGYPIEIITDISHPRLVAEYERAKIFWHAAGYCVDQEKYPEQVEHFGIATAEAMAAGCVPVVINKGGQPEIVSSIKQGFLWESEAELYKLTLQLIKDETGLNRISKECIKSTKRFSKQNFCKQLTGVTR